MNTLKFSACLCLLLLCQCKNPGNPSVAEPAAVDSLAVGLDSMPGHEATLGTDSLPPNEFGGYEGGTPGKPVKLDIENPDLFSPEFLNSLIASGAAERAQLTDSFLIADQKDTILFPMDLPLNEWTNFAAIKGKYLYSLDVARLNLSTLEFNFELLRSGTPVDQLRGKAHLNGAFFLAAEMDEDERTGETYPAIEYYCTDHKNCNFSIRIGEMEGKLKVKVIKTCKSGKFDIALDDCPTLLEK